MKSNEFLNEVLNSELCPENFGEIYQEFNAYQKLVGDILKEFHNICERNHITYQVAYGSLIGAIRDGGQIPWDYDVDVLVPAEEREDLMTVLSKELSEKYYFHCPETDSLYSHFFMRITPKEYNSEHLHVDVFYLVGLPDDIKMEAKIRAEIKKLAYIRYGKHYNIHKLVRISKHKIRRLIKLTLIKIWAYCHFYVDEYERYLAIVKKYPAKACSHCVINAINDGNYAFPQKMLSNSMLINTDLGLLRVPECYDEILNGFYGDYKKTPPLNRRIEEVLHNYAILKQFAKEE